MELRKEINRQVSYYKLYNILYDKPFSFFFNQFDNNFICIVSFAWWHSRNKGKKIPNIFPCHFFPFQPFLLCSLTWLWMLFSFLVVKIASQDIFVFRHCVRVFYQFLISFCKEQVNASAHFRPEIMEIFDSGHLSKLLWYLRVDHLEISLGKRPVRIFCSLSHKPWLQVD